MQIIATYDPSVANAPAGFKQAVNAAIQYFDTTISNNITVNISFGWGEVNGQTLGSGDLGESVSNYFTGFTYNQVVSALAPRRRSRACRPAIRPTAVTSGSTRPS